MFEIDKTVINCIHKLVLYARKKKSASKNSQYLKINWAFHQGVWTNVVYEGKRVKTWSVVKTNNSGSGVTCESIEVSLTSLIFNYINPCLIY